MDEAAVSPEAEGGVFGRERRALTVGILLAVMAFAAEGMGEIGRASCRERVSSPV